MRCLDLLVRGGFVISVVELPGLGAVELVVGGFSLLGLPGGAFIIGYEELVRRRGSLRRRGLPAENKTVWVSANHFHRSPCESSVAAAI